MFQLILIRTVYNLVYMTGNQNWKSYYSNQTNKNVRLILPLDIANVKSNEIVDQTAW